jgi:hypothetical protein
MKNLQSPDLTSWEPFVKDYSMELSDAFKKYLRSTLTAQHGGHVRNDLILSALFSIYRWKSFAFGSITDASERKIKAICLNIEKNEITRAFSSHLGGNVYLVPLDQTVSLFLFETSTEGSHGIV